MVKPLFYTERGNKQLFYAERSIYGTKVMTHGREIPACNSRGLEKRRHRIWHRDGHEVIRDGSQDGTSDPTVINNSTMVSYRNTDLGKTGFRDKKENKEVISSHM